MRVVVASGKGGTGKTSVTAALAHQAALTQPGRWLLADADVDAANLALLRNWGRRWVWPRSPGCRST